MSLSLEELEAIVNAVTDLGTHTDQLEDMTIDDSISSMDMELFNIQLEQIAHNGYNDFQEHKEK